MDDKSVKKKLRQLREKENLSQLELAEKLGISLRSYNSLETGDTRIFNRNLEKVARLTGAKLEEIILGDEYETLADGSREDFDRFKEMHRAAVKSYEDALSAARAELQSKDRQIESLEDRIKDKEKLVRLLEKQLEGECKDSGQ